MNTIADMIDRLTVINLKLWFVQDRLHWAAKEGTALPNGDARAMVELNLERNSLTGEIDDALAKAIETGVVPKKSRIKLT